MSLIFKTTSISTCSPLPKERRYTYIVSKVQTQKEKQLQQPKIERTIQHRSSTRRDKGTRSWLLGKLSGERLKDRRNPELERELPKSDDVNDFQVNCKRCKWRPMNRTCYATNSLGGPFQEITQNKNMVKRLTDEISVLGPRLMKLSEQEITTLSNTPFKSTKKRACTVWT